MTVHAIKALRPADPAPPRRRQACWGLPVSQGAGQIGLL